MLGNLPLVGRLFSPEKGGGVFAARFGVEGSIDDPSISINPISALTPGFLRDIFGVFDRVPVGNNPAHADGAVSQPSGIRGFYAVCLPQSCVDFSQYGRSRNQSGFL